MAAAKDSRKGLTSDQNKVADMLDSYLAGKGSPLAGYGGTFVFWGDNYGINPAFLVSIAGSETNFGKYGPSQQIKNPFGMGPGIKYSSYEQAISAAAKNLKENKAYSGKDTISAIGGVWAPVGASNDPSGLNNHWVTNVSKFYKELGQNPSESVRKRAIADKGIIEGTKDALGDTVNDMTGGITGSIGSLVSAVMDWHFWARVAMVIGGASLVFGALFMLFKNRLPSMPMQRVISKKPVTKTDVATTVADVAS